MSSSDEHSAAEQIESTLQDLAKQTREPQDRAVKRVERKSSRLAQAAVIISLILGFAGIAGSGWNSVHIAENTASQALTQQGLDSLREANKELEARGLQTVPEPPPGQSLDINALVAATAAVLKTQIASDPSFKGPEGSTGATGRTGRTGDTGEQGKPGRDGSQGQQGPSPSDQQVFGQVQNFCNSLLQPCKSTTPGPAGPKGDQGDKGEKGDPGPVCPEGFTPQTFWVDVYDDDQVLTPPHRVRTALCV